MKAILLKIVNNHDDGIQSFNLGTYDVRNITIRNNVILNYDDPNQNLLGPLQGIGCFDGPFDNWLIENNIVSVNHWHGISLYGAFDCKIYHNTVIDPRPDLTPGPSWIRITDNKNGTPSERCEVKNNVANSFSADAELSHNIVLKNYQDYEDNFEDYSQYNFILKPGSVLIDAADPCCYPSTDIYGNVRPQGSLPDVGAVEYVKPVGTVNFEKSNAGFTIYPNPVSSLLNVYYNQEIPRKKSRLQIIDAQGKVIYHSWIAFPEKLSNIPVLGLTPGFYELKIEGLGSKKFVVAR